MNSPDSQAKLPTWVFIFSNVALVGLAAYIAATAGSRPSKLQIITIVVCVVLGAIATLVPLVARQERLKNEALDERQRALEALARTVASSAEQISIAANGLHEIAELAQKNLRHAEQLPHKLQDKIAEFQAQLAQTADADKEELERELLALRTTESERLESVSQRIAKSSAEWAKLEAATQQHLAAATEALAKLQLGTANAIGKAQAAAEQALAQARTEAARNLGEASGNAIRAIESAKSSALAEFEEKIAAAAKSAAERIAAELRAGAPAATADRPVEAASAESSSEPIPSTDTSPPFAAAATPAPVASAPKRPRKPRREEPVDDTPPPFEVPAAATDASVVEFDEPTPIPPARFAEITPVAPHTVPPFDPAVLSSPNGEHVEPPATSLEPEAPKPAKKRPAKKPEPDPEPSLGLDLDDPSSRAAAAGVLERVLSSDGATRLLVTAYIGIGNRLFIRGEGPGLSWDKGVPLQFVSIGKWRWETNDANAPVQFKLYKNDDVECAALGTQTLEAGHQQEVTASF